MSKVVAQSKVAGIDASSYPVFGYVSHVQARPTREVVTTENKAAFKP